MAFGPPHAVVGGTPAAAGRGLEQPIGASTGAPTGAPIGAFQPPRDPSRDRIHPSQTRVPWASHRSQRREAPRAFTKMRSGDGGAMGAGRRREEVGHGLLSPAFFPRSACPRTPCDTRASHETFETLV